jgi:serine/threonine-protein kinase
MGREGRSIGRYVLYDRIASGGMAQVHVGRLVGAVGFSRTVAIKRLLPHCATDAEIVPMFVDEARLAARIRHPNVVGTLDVVRERDELILVMEYVHGESLARLLSRARARGERVAAPIAVGIALAVLEGLHAAHEARSERGEPLGIVHRDVSPQNIIVGADGVPRVVDFGIAKARGRIQTTRDGQLKGKAGYVAPEQLLGMEIDRRVDIYATGVVLWEMLAGRRLFEGDGPAVVMRNVLEQRIEPPSRRASGVPRALDDVVMRALSRAPSDRFATAREMVVALERTVMPASAREIERWVHSLAADMLAERAALVAAIENDSAQAFAGDGGERIYEATSMALLRPAARGKPSDDVPTESMSFTPIGVADVPRRPVAPERSRSRGPWAVGAALVTGGLLAFALVRSGANVGSSGLGGATPAAPPPEETTEAAETTETAPVVEDETPAARAAATVAAQSSTPTPTPPPTVTQPAGARRAPARQPATRLKQTPPSCVVPFTRAADGTKIPKPECF